MIDYFVCEIVLKKLNKIDLKSSLRTQIKMRMKKLYRTQIKKVINLKTMRSQLYL